MKLLFQITFKGNQRTRVEVLIGLNIGLRGEALFSNDSRFESLERPGNSGLREGNDKVQSTQ